MLPHEMQRIDDLRGYLEWTRNVNLWIPPSQILYVFSSALNPGNKGKDANHLSLISWD